MITMLRFIFVINYEKHKAPALLRPYIDATADEHDAGQHKTVVSLRATHSSVSLLNESNESTILIDSFKKTVTCFIFKQISCLNKLVKRIIQ